MAEKSTLIPFDALEGSSEFQSLPVADKLAAIDGWADATLEGTGYADPDSVAGFARQAKDDYKRDAFAKAIDSRIDKSLTGEARAKEAERLANEAFDDAQRMGYLTGRDVPSGSIGMQGAAGARVGGGFKPRDAELSGLVKDYFLTQSERDGTDEQELDIGEGVKIAARQLPHPGKDIFKFRLPDGREVLQEGPSMQEAVKTAIQGNLDAFPDTGGDILARLGRGALDQGLLRMGEGVAGAAAMTGTRAFFAPDVLASGSIGRATGNYQEAMAPVVARDAELQRGAIEQTRAETVRDIINRIAPINPREAAESAVGLNNETLRQVPYALGQAAANIGVGAAAGPAAPAVLGVGNIAAMGDQAAQEAVAAGRPEKAASAFLDAGVPGGLVETATDLFFTKAFSGAFGNALNAARRGSTSALVAAAKTGLKNATLGGLQEGAAEGLQGVIANDVARRYYDENRDLFEGVEEQAAVGALTGVILGGLTGGIKGAQTQRAKTLDEQVADKTRETAEAVAAATESAPEVQIQQEKAAELRDNGLPKLAAALEARAEANVDAAVAENVAKVGEVATELAGRLDEIEAELQSENLPEERRKALFAEFDAISTEMGIAPEPIANETGIEIPTQLGEQAAEQAANPLPAVSEVQAQGEQAPVGAGVVSAPSAMVERNVDLFPETTDFAGKLDKEAVISEYIPNEGFGVARYQNPETGVDDVIIAAASDADYLGFIRVYENGKPTNRWTSKLERRTNAPGLTRAMMESLSRVLPEGHQWAEDISVSTDGIRFLSGQTRHGYRVLTENGKPVTTEVAISGEGVGLPSDVIREDGSFENIRVQNKKQFEAVQPIIAQLLERYGVGLGEQNVRWENGTVFVDLPVLEKVAGAPATIQQASGTARSAVVEPSPTAVPGLVLRPAPQTAQFPANEAQISRNEALPRSQSPSTRLMPRAVAPVSPRPDREGRDTTKRDAWDEQYGQMRRGGPSHNSDGSIYQPTLKEEVVQDILTDLPDADFEGQIDAIGVGFGAELGTAVTQFLDAGWVWDSNQKRMVNPADPAESPASGIERIRSQKNGNASVNPQVATNTGQIAPNETQMGVNEVPSSQSAINTEQIDSNQPAPLFQREVTQTEELGPNLVLNVERMENGDWRVAKVNTATGRELPLPDGAPAVFTNEKEALNFARSAVGRPAQEATTAPQEAQAKPAKLSDDDLISLVLSEGIPATYSDISQISKVTRRTGKGFRGIDRDVSRLGEFTNAPRIGEFKGNAEAQGVLQRMYRTDGSGINPDVLADRAFNREDGGAPLISAPTAEALFEGIKERLRGDATRVATAFNNQEAEAAATNFATQQQANADAFYGNLNSIYRSGGVINAAGLQEGDVLVLGDDTLTVTGATENGPVVLSRKYGEFQLNPQDRVGYDRFESEAGLPVDQRDDSLPDEIVDRAESETITKRLQEDRRLGNVRAVTSAEHNALSGDRRALDAARRLAAMFGYRIVGVTGANFNGVVVRKEGENDRNIYMRVNPTRPELNIVVHELLHQMRKDAPELYRRLVQLLRADIKRYLSEVRPENAGLSEEAQIEEFLADYLGELALDPAFWQSLAAKDPGLFEQLADFVLKFLRSIVDRIKKDKIKVEHLIQDAASFRDAVENVLVEFRYRQDAIAKGLIETDTVQFDEDSNMPFADRLTDQDREYLDAVERGDMETAQRMVDEAARAAGYGVGPVYHGSPDFSGNIFDREFLGRNTGVSRGGFNFTENRERAEAYSSAKVSKKSAKLSDQVAAFNKAFRSVRLTETQKERFSEDTGGWDWDSAELSDRVVDDVWMIEHNVNTFAPWLEKNGFSDAAKAMRDSLAIGSRTRQPRVIAAYLKSPRKEIQERSGDVIYVAESSSQIKSADPVTYDESGNVIPLSQRFNEASDDIRFADYTPGLTEEQYARHEELEAKHNAGTITEEETKEAQGLVDRAARASGFDVGPVWHGTASDFNIPKGKRGLAAFVSKDKAFAQWIAKAVAEEMSEWGEANNGGKVLRWYLRGEYFDPSNPNHSRRISKTVSKEDFQWDNLEASWDGGATELQNEIRNAGFDGYMASEGPGQPLDTIAIFSPNQIKLADPFTGVPLRERFNPESDDIRFADREPQEKRQQEFGVKDGREDVVESLVNDVIPSVKERFFNGEQPVSYWGKEDAARVLADYESGRLDVSKELGKDAGNQALIGELWRYAGRVLAEDGDSTLWHRLKGHMNDFSDREATVSGRVLAARRYYTTLLDGTIKAVNEAKRKVVNDIAPSENGQQVDLAAELEQASREIDNLKRRIDELEKRAPEAFAELDLIPTKAPPKPRGGRRVGPRESALDAQIDADIESFLAGGDLRFADQEQETLNKVQFIRDLVRKKSRVSDSTSKGTFINALVESGGLDKARAEQLYAYAMAKRQERKDAQKVDAEEARKKKVAEQTVQQRLQEAAIKSAARTDKVNRKLNALADKYDKAPKNFKKKGNLDPISASVADAVAQGDKFDRDTFIKRWVSDGADPDVVAKLATSIEVRIQANKAAGRKSNQTPAEQLRAIVNRHKNPMERSRREKSPVRKLATDTLKVESPITEDGFMAQAKTLGIPKAEAQSLWQDLTALRQERQQVREAERQARELEEGTPEQAEAKALIAKLAQSQSDTQDNRPAPPVELSIVEQLYRDAIGFGPVRSRGGFVSELEGAGVDTDTANRLFDLALKERANRLEVEKAKVADRTIQNMGVRENQRASSGPLPRLSEEILNHPMLTIAGPQERLEIMARIIEARSGLSAVDARIAAAKFDAQLVKVWEQVSLDVAEKYVLKRNAPGFRKEPGSGTPKDKPSLFDQIRKAIRAGAYDPRRRTLDEVAKQNGWSDLTEEENAELARLDVKLNESGLTDFESGKIKREMARIINGSSLPDEASKVIREFFLANVFSGLSTLGVQTSALWTQVLNVVLRDSLGAIAGTATGSQRMNLTGYTAALMNLTNQFKNAVADSSVALKTGQIRGVTEEEIINAQSKLERVYDRNVKILDDPKASATAKGIALGKILLSASRFFLRNLSMMDNFVQGGIRTYLRDVELFSQAAGLGMSVSDIRKMTSAVLSMSGDFAADAEARGFGNVEVAGRSLPVPSPEKLAYINDRIAMALNDALARKGIPRSMIEASKDRSYREAAMETGVNEFQTGQFKLLRAGMEALRSVQQKGGVMGAVFIPVLRTVFNMMDRGAWYTPYGLWRLAGVRQKTKGFKEWRTAQGKLTSPYETALADPEQLIRRSMETALGTAIVVGAGALLASQADEPEEERLFRVNLGGPPPSERSKFTAWRKAGHRPYSLQFRSSKDADWSTVGFRRGGMEVFNLAFTVVGAWDQKQFAKRKNESDLEAYGWTVLKELSGELLFPLRPLTSRQASVSADSLAGQIGYYVSGFVPAASLLKTPARFRDFQDYTGPGAAFASQIPVVQMTLPDTPRLNSLGDPIEARGNSSFDQWARFGIPFGVTPKAPDLKPGQKPEDAHVYMLMRDKEYFPAVKTEADFEGAVSHEQYREFVKKRGKMLKDYVKSNYKTLEGMDTDKFQETLSERGRKITTQVQRQMGIKKP